MMWEERERVRWQELIGGERKAELGLNKTVLCSERRAADFHVHWWCSKLFRGEVVIGSAEKGEFRGGVGICVGRGIHHDSITLLTKYKFMQSTHVYTLAFLSKMSQEHLEKVN